MANVGLSLAARIACIGNQPEPVRTRRNAYLAARGQVETLVLYCLQSAGQLAHGRYQASMTSAITNKHKLAPIAERELIEAVESLEQALPELFTTLDACACYEVVRLSSPEAVAQIASEVDECTKRLKAVYALLADWKLALSTHARETALKATASPRLAPALEPLDPPDLT